MKDLLYYCPHFVNETESQVQSYTASKWQIQMQATGFKSDTQAIMLYCFSWNCVNWTFLELQRTTEMKDMVLTLKKKMPVNFKMDKARWVEIFNNHLEFSLVEQHDRNNFIFIQAKEMQFYVCVWCACLKTRWKLISSPNSLEVDSPEHVHILHIWVQLY